MPNLVTSIRVISLASNNLLELPMSFMELDEHLDDMRIEYNPMASPPADVIAEGMAVVKQYCRIRRERMRELADILDEYGFDTDIEHYAPQAHQALTGRTGFLTPDDQSDFDAAVDALVNGAYYKCPVSSAEVVDKVDQLRHERKFVFYNDILQQLLKVCAEESQGENARFSKNVLDPNVTRPWGRGGEEVPCFAVSLAALTTDTMPNAFLREYRPPLYDLVKARLPPSLFEYSLEVRCDALQCNVMECTKHEYSLEVRLSDGLFRILRIRHTPRHIGLGRLHHEAR